MFCNCIEPLYTYPTSCIPNWAPRVFLNCPRPPKSSKMAKFSNVWGRFAIALALCMALLTHRAEAMAVAAKKSYTVTLLPGDGIGPEIMSACTPVLDAVAAKRGFAFTYREADIGGIAIDRHNDPFPQSTMDACRSADSILLASIGGYKWDNNPREMRPETGLLKMRKGLNLFANLRPAKVRRAP